MHARRERRLPLVLASIAAGASVALAARAVVGLRGLPAPWALGLATAAVMAAVVAGRMARAWPVPHAAGAPADPREAMRPEAPPSRLGAWPLLRGALAAIGAVVVLTAASLAAIAAVGPPVRRVLEAHGLVGRPVLAVRSAHPDQPLYGPPHLKTFRGVGGERP